jgi:ketosteroid isomerase-like protein
MSDGTMSGAPAMSADDVKSIAERYQNALTTQDFDTMRDVFAEDVEVRWPQSGEHFKGKETCIRVFTTYPGGSPKMVTAPRVTVSGNLAIGEGELEYPDGKRYHTVAIMEVRDGKIARETDYFAEPFPAPEWRMQWVEHD